MAARFGLAFALAMVLSTPTLAQTIVVDEDFESYPTHAEDSGAAFQATWVPTTANGTLPANAADLSSGIITNDATAFPGIQGKAVDHIGATASTPGMVNQFGGVIDQTTAQNPDFTINPSATENVFLSADIFVGTSGNERMTVGLRHITATGAGAATTVNLFEMGAFNGNPTVLGIPGTVQPVPAGEATAGYAFRIILFDPATPSPNWQYWELPAELEGPDADTIVKINDVGAGWHTYTAEFSPTEITVTIDLFRDGLRNTSITPDPISGIRPGTPGLDGSLSFPVSTLPAGFNSLRLGGPSGVSSAGSGVMGFDNVLLQLQSSVVPPTDDADFDNDLDVDGEDFLIWQRNNGTVGGATNAIGDANADMDVDGDDLGIWTTEFGTPQATAAVGAIPEPATAALAAVALLASLAAARRR